MKALWRPLSVKTYLLAWIIVPITGFIVIDSFTLYRNTLDSANTAYDRMVVTTAYSIGDALRIEDGQLSASESYAALDVLPFASFVQTASIGVGIVSGQGEAREQIAVQVHFKAFDGSFLEIEVVLDT